MAAGDIVTDPDLLNQLEGTPPTGTPVPGQALLKPPVTNPVTLGRLNAMPGAAEAYMGEDPAQASVLMRTLAGVKHGVERGMVGVKTLFTNPTPDDVSALVGGEAAVREGGTPAEVGQFLGETLLAAPFAGTGSLLTSGLSFIPRLIGQSVAGGAAGAALSPEDWQRAFKYGLVGGALGETAASGVGRVLTGAVKPSKAAGTLMEAGVQPTIGQAADTGSLAGKVLRSGESALTSVPLLGDVIQSARGRAIKELNQAALDRSYPPDVTEYLAGRGDIRPRTAPEIGRGGIADTQNEFTRQYGTALSGINAKLDQQTSRALFDIESGADNPLLNREGQTAITNWVNQRIGGAVNNRNSAATGEILKQLESEANTNARQMIGSDNLQTDAMGKAFAKLHDVIVDWRNRNATPQQRTALDALDQQYANFVRVQQAAGSAGATGGVFNPVQLAAAVRSTSPGLRKGQYAAGEALMQNLSDPAKEILSSALPESGTTPRALWTALGAGLAGGGGAVLGHPGLLGLPIPLSAYTRWGSKFLLGGYPKQQMLADLLRSPFYGTVGGTLGTAGALQREE